MMMMMMMMMMTTIMGIILILTPWCWIFFEKLIVTHAVKQQPAFFMEPEGSLP
jgi:hypothetical protein